MITLQKSFRYQGDPENSGFDKIMIDLTYPLFEYLQSKPDDPVSRHQVSSATAEFVQELNKDNYQAKLPTSSVTGKNDTLKLFLRYTVQCMTRDHDDVDGLTISIDYQTLTDTKLPLSNRSFDALYFIKRNGQRLADNPQLSHREAELSHHEANTSETSISDTYFENNIILVNKEAYTRLLTDFKTIAHVEQDLILLDIIQKFISAVNPDLNKLMELNENARSILLEIIRSEKIKDIEHTAEFIQKNLDRLFDFPIIVDEIKAIEVAGKFHIKTTNDLVINQNDLLFYDLYLEYSTINNIAGLQSIHYDWQTGDTIEDNSVNFSLTAHQPIILNSITGPVTIHVKGFDGSLLWSESFKPEDRILQDLTIEVPLSRPNVIQGSTQPAKADKGKKLRGQLVGLTKKCPLKDATVIIQAKKEGDENWRVVAAATTDNSGNFSMPYPFGSYVAAQALISLTPDSPADIPVDPTNKEEQTIADDFLYLLVTDPVCEEPDKEEDDCDCHTPKKAARLPDQADLINSDEYTQDIGGGCVNLSTPNRTLSEYSYQGIVRTSDPDVANYTLKKITQGPFTLLTPGLFSGHVSPIKTRYELTGGAEKIKRSAVDLNNPIRWQDAPDAHENLTIYQAVTIATGHILHYRSEFKADGYSLGNLLYSLPLAPGQKKQIVMMDSQHQLQGTENQNIIQTENLASNLVNERNIADQLGGGINESLFGQSSATTSGVSAGLGVAANIGVVSGALGVAGGYANSNSSASQNSSRNTAQFFGEKLRQSIMQNADGYRQLNATIITTVKEGQQYSAVTEVVANHNHCHALTMMYFEVLRHYAIYQELVSVEECVFVPMLMTNFTVDNIYKWGDILSRNLLPMHSSTYLQPFGFLRLNRQHPLLKAFDANERIKTNYENVDFPTGRYCDEEITSVSGTITIRADIPRPKTRFDRILSLPVIKKTITEQGGVDVNGTIKANVKSSILGAVTGGLSFLFGGGPSVKYKTISHDVLTRGEIFDLFMSLDENYDTVPPAQCIRVHNFNPLTILVNDVPKTIDFFDGMPDDKKIWEAYARVLQINIYELMNKFSGNVISDWNRLFFDDIAPDIIKELFNEKTVSFKPFGGLDLTSLNNYSGREQLLKYNFTAETTLKRVNIPELNIIYSFNSTITDEEKGTLQKKVRLNVESLQVNYDTNHYHGRIFNRYVGNDIMDNVHLYTPLNFDEKRNPRKEDIFIVNKLIEHLNSNLEHYNKSLWYNLDADRRYMLLDGFNIQIYNDFGLPAGFRSLASVVKNQLITITGNSMVFPVAAGYKVSQSYITEVTEDNANEQVSLFDHYKPLTPIPPYRISVPSKGVFLEAIQGACDACEKIKENSAQDWTKFTADEPTSFTPVTPPVPTITDWKAAFKDLAPPLINIQNAPALPDPGVGLAGLTELLGKSGIFKDITGLDANQQNVIKTFLSNQENAKAFAEMAKGMATQGHNTQNSDKIMDTLKTAKDTGAINQDDYGKLVKEHIQKQIDGGETPLSEDAKNKTSLSKAAVDAAAKGQDVKATKTDSATGLAETLEVTGAPTATTPDGDILIVKILIPQPANPALLKTYDQNTDSIGFGLFDNAFDPAKPNNPAVAYNDTSNGLKANFIDNESHRFYIEITDSLIDAAANTIEVDWLTTFGDRVMPYDLTPNPKLTLYRDTTAANTFRSKALLLVHEEVDLDIVVDGKHKGEDDFRMRLAGMFAYIKIKHNARLLSFTFPVFNQKNLHQVPINIFTLRNSSNNPVATADAVGTSIAKLQDVYDNVGVLFNAGSEYQFTGTTLAQASPTPTISKRNIDYKVNEITLPATINISALKQDDLVAIANLLPPAPNKLRIFIVDKFDPSFLAANVIALGCNKSYAAAISPNLVNCLFVKSIATGSGFPYTIAHELGHILMDKMDYLSSHSLPVPATNSNHHYNSNNPQLPNSQDLMNPSTVNQVSIFSSKRIWNVKDADNYNQYEDLLNDRMGLMK